MTTALVRPETDLAAIVAGHVGDYALVRRGGAAGIEVLTGPATVVPRLADLPLPPVDGRDRADLLVVMPYRQLVEKGYACVDDAVPMVALAIDRVTTAPLADALAALPSAPPRLRTAGRFDLDDAGYAAAVRRVIDDEIGQGAGSNFVLRRTWTAELDGDTPTAALGVFRALLAAETGAYWTFIVHCGGRTLVGATPERHLALADGVARMHPVSGTYRYPAAGPDVDEVLRFLADDKERDELHMVVDEELKLMARVCPAGGRVVGPELTEMARLAHTAYRIEGYTEADPRDLLRASLFAPTVTGSPVENACRVIARHERSGRGYYGGAIVLIGQSRGTRTVDSAILIRTADIDHNGQMAIAVGATVVRHSDPRAEAAETRAKAAALLDALGVADPGGVAGPDDLAHPTAGVAGPVGVAAPPGVTGPLAVADRVRLADDPRVARALAERRRDLAPYWLAPIGRRSTPVPALAGIRLLVVDAEDTFTAMLAAQARSIGPEVRVVGWADAAAVLAATAPDLVLLGPGPGDPRDRVDARVVGLRRLAAGLLRGLRQGVGPPVLAVCLGHQLVAGLLGLPLRRRGVPAQGQRTEIDFFGVRERVGCYHTFAAYCDAPVRETGRLATPVEISRDPGTGEVHGLRAPGLRSMQFHLESVLTARGPALLTQALVGLLPEAVCPGGQRHVPNERSDCPCRA